MRCERHQCLPQLANQEAYIFTVAASQPPSPEPHTHKKAVQKDFRNIQSLSPTRTRTLLPPPEENSQKKTVASLVIERVILSAGAMLIFSVLFQIDQVPEGEGEMI